MPSLWEAIHRIQEKQPLPEGLQGSYQKEHPKMNQRRSKEQRSVENPQQDSDSSEQEFDRVEQKFSIFIVSDQY